MFGTINCYPSSIDYPALLKHVEEQCTRATPTAAQVSDLVRMKEIRGILRTQGNLTPFPLVKEWAIRLCRGFLDPELMTRVDMNWSVRNRLFRCGAYGCTSLRDPCRTHQHNHRVQILIDPRRKNGEPRRDWADRILATVLHEVVHAYIAIYLNEAVLSIRERVVIIGPGGHGMVFERLFQLLARSLQAKGVLDIDLTRDVLPSIGNTRQRRDLFFKAAWSIDNLGLTTRGVNVLLGAWMHVSTDKLAEFHILKMLGFPTLEGLLVVCGESFLAGH